VVKPGQNSPLERRGTSFPCSFVDKEYGWAVGDFSTIVHTRDGGENWELQSEESDRIYSSIYFTDRN